MHGFLDSFQPILARYKSEVILLSVAGSIGIISLIAFFLQIDITKQKLNTTVQEVAPSAPSFQKKTTLVVDISGAVKKPSVYSLPYNSRIIDAIQKAGGLTEDADTAFVIRNFNYARLLNDQEKIYVPFLSDTANGYVVENKRIIDYTLPNTNSIQTETTSRINVNTASVIELDKLPGIGKVQGEAIVNGRPYGATEDLVKNEIIKQLVYDKIKDLISTY